jgi:hypothetical protein
MILYHGEVVELCEERHLDSAIQGFEGVSWVPF